MKFWKVSCPQCVTTVNMKRWSECNRYWWKKEVASKTARLVHLCTFAMISDYKGRGYESGTIISLSFRISTTALSFCLPFDVDFYTTKTGKLKEVWDLVKQVAPMLAIHQRYRQPAFAICDPADIPLVWYQQSWTASRLSKKQSSIGQEEHWQNLEIPKWKKTPRPTPERAERLWETHTPWSHLASGSQAQDWLRRVSFLDQMVTQIVLVGNQRTPSWAKLESNSCKTSF